MTTTGSPVRPFPEHRAEYYNEAFPDRPQLHYSQGWVTGTWAIGACYKNPNKLYGAYPHGYLERVHSMFPDARRVLHAFSGGLTKDYAATRALDTQFRAIDKIRGGREMYPGEVDTAAVEVELVDIHGPDGGRFPTWRGDLMEFCDELDNVGRFDLVLADPPYSAEDAEVYECPPPNRAKIMRALAKVTRPAGNLVWLDQVWPQHRKTEWRTWAHIGLVRSTNHRMRLISMFGRAV